MTIGRAGLRAARRLQPRPATLEAMQARNLPNPPRTVLERNSCEVLSVDGARAVWLDKHHLDAGVMVFLHGGSYVTGPHREEWDWFSRLCVATGLAGLLIDYRLAPQHPFPGGLQDALAIVGCVARDHPSPGWFLLGDSAGGGLALAVAYSLRDRGEPMPSGLVLVSPWLDVTMASPFVRRNQRIDPMLSPASLARAAGAYAAGHDPRDALISPLFGDPAGLPPMLMQGGDRELFVWDMRAWERRCRQAGTEITYLEQPGGFHCYPMVVSLIPEANVALSRQVGFLSRLRARW